MRPHALCSIALALCINLSSSSPVSRSPTGPVISSNFQGPSIIKVSNTYYAFSGPNENPAVNIQLATSPDFLTWTPDSGYDALPDPGPWAAFTPHVWAPDANQLADGTFILYYCAAVISSPSQHCVGAALSPTILGPYSPLSSPLTCDLSTGGSIDPDGFTDPQTGARYLIYKVDGNSLPGGSGACANGDGTRATPILLQQVQADGYTLVGPVVEILTNDPSDGAGIEAPSLFYDAASGLYVLTFNSGCFTQSTYQIAYARSRVVTGPYTRMGPLVVTGQTSGDIQLPGGLDVLGSSSSGVGLRAVLHGDLNLGWFQGVGLRDRGLYAVELSVARDGSVGVASLY
jgi:beta-xylosidase